MRDNSLVPQKKLRTSHGDDSFSLMATPVKTVPPTSTLHLNTENITCRCLSNKDALSPGTLPTKPRVHFDLPHYCASGMVFSVDFAIYYPSIKY